MWWYLREAREGGLSARDCIIDIHFSLASFGNLNPLGGWVGKRERKKASRKNARANRGKKKGKGVMLTVFWDWKICLGIIEKEEKMLALRCSDKRGLRDRMVWDRMD